MVSEHCVLFFSAPAVGGSDGMDGDDDRNVAGFGAPRLSVHAPSSIYYPYLYLLLLSCSARDLVAVGITD